MLIGGIKIYTVHVKPGDFQPQEKPIFVREGFNWWAFIFTGLWALYHRLWLQMLLILAVNGILFLMSTHHIIALASVVVLRLGFQVTIGFWANDWLRAQLGRRGYVFTDLAASDSLLRAEQRYFERVLAH